MENLEGSLYIISRLWYTAWTALRKRNNDSSLKEPIHDPQELMFLIKSAITLENWQIQWIAQNILSDLECGKNIAVQEDLNLLEILIAIRAIDNHIPEDIEQELLDLYTATTNAKHGNYFHVKNLSKTTLTFLESNLQINPADLCFLFNKLLCIWSTDFLITDIALQNSYIDALKGILKRGCLQQASPSNSSIRPTNHFHRSNFMSTRDWGVFLCILSRIELTESKENDLLQWLYPELLKMCSNDDIELVLYSRKDSKFLTEWFKFLDATCARYKNADILSESLNIFEILFILDDNGHTFVNFKELLTRVVKRKCHWLTDVVNICFTLLTNGHYELVTTILSSSLLEHLWPTLLFKYISDCPNSPIVSSSKALDNGRDICNNLKFLLDKCNFSGTKDHTLKMLNILLRSHINVVEWILNCKQINLKQKDSALESNGNLNKEDYKFSIKRVFSLLHDHNILAVLHMIINIHEIDYNEIKLLLKESSETLNIFQAYHIMLHALKIILLCGSYSSNYKDIMEHQCNVRSSLQSLYPLSLRLETIENIFSMLFLRYEDFHEYDSSSDGGEEEVIISLEEKYSEKVKTKLECYETGFVCNTYAVREILHLLKRCTVETGIECAKLKKENTCSDEVDVIQKTMSSITKALVDAMWRLELFTCSNFIQNAGTVDYNEQAKEYIKGYAMRFRNEKLNSSLRPKSKSTFYSQYESSSDETELKSDVDGSSETGSPGNTTGNKRRRKRSRNITSTLDSCVLHNFKEGSDIISFMLASKKNLVAHCLWKGNYEKAQQVVEMFNMRNTDLDGEIRFSKTLQDLRKELEKLIDFSCTNDAPKEQTSLSMLENLRHTVYGSIQAFRLTSFLETFLASQEVNVRLLNSEVVNSEDATMTVLDLALTMGKNWLSCAILCDVAMKHLKLCKKLENTGHFTYFSKIYRLFHESKLKMSLMDILSNAQIPLLIKEWKSENNFWSELTERLQGYRKSCSIDDHTIGQLKINNHMAQESFQKILSLCNDGDKYLHKIYAHAKLLSTLIWENNDDGFMEFDVLKESLDFYLGHQIFDLNVDPDKLIPIANTLGVNLVYSVLINCCPKLSYNIDSNVTNDNNKWGYIILNKTSEKVDCWKSCEQDPNKCVVDLLSEILQVFRRLHPGKSRLTFNQLKSVSKHTEVQSVLTKTSCLATLDLSDLSVGNETLAFFLNIWNLLFLHTILVVWSQDPPFNKLRHTVSLMATGYEIGDLGLVTLATLRLKLLGSLAWNFEFFTQMEDLNEVAWQDLDLTQDPKTIFTMANEFYGTPRIQIYYSDTLDRDLNEAAKEYIKHFVSMSNINYTNNLHEENVIWLPELMQRYQNSALQHLNLKTDMDDTSELQDEFLLNNWSKLSEKNSVLKFMPLKYVYEIKLLYSDDDLQSENFINQVDTKSDTVNWKSREIRPTLLHYLDGHCWLLPYLVQRIHEESPTIWKTNCDNLKRTSCLENLINSPWAKTLKSLFYDNQTLSGIQDEVVMNSLWNYLETAVSKNNWQTCLEIINALPDRFLLKNVEIQCFRDKVLSRLISDQMDSTNSQVLSYIHQIKSIQILAQTILLNIKEWPVRVCEDALLYALHHVDKDKLPHHCKLEMNEILCRVTVYRKMLPYCTAGEDGTWYDVVYCTDKTDPVHVVKSLIDANKFELCLEWLEYQAFSPEIQSLVTQDLLIGLLKNDHHDFKQASKLLQALPINHSIKMCKGVLGKLESIHALQFVNKYLLEHCSSSESPKYRRSLTGINILSNMESKERSFYVHLIEEPLLMLEQLLMNCKFENLQKILNKVQESLKRAEIPIEEFDAIVRFYAGKSLDFRVAIQREGIENKSKEISRSFSETDATEFVMPLNIPTKEEWVPNDKARECSCCRAVIFSMFNRRHHCRRCGRVVCAVCSQQRMRVPGYPNSVLVRVCDDCKRQTSSQLRSAQGAPSVPGSEVFDCWRLTLDQSHDRSVREEFSFEHAPNVSLCLAILNLHSDHKAYASFLLDRCDEMKQLLQPVGGKVNPEVDHSLIIKMIKSLLVAAKVKCAKLGLNAGLAHCDRFLSQVDLITTLVQLDCLALLPSGDLDEHALRRLRDLLTEKEQWTLALDVSTKSGLETQGVWAAWGKSCLKVGLFSQAREKFMHCLDKVLYEDLDDWVLVSHSTETAMGLSRRDSKGESTASGSAGPKRHEVLKSRPIKDPPLLLEILQILENSHVNNQSLTHTTQNKTAGAQDVLNALNSLKAISQGQCIVPSLSWNASNPYYQESLHYLVMYGSSCSILEFFVKYGEIDKCLSYVLEHEVDPELFFHGVYLRCLKNGTIEVLKEAMLARDFSLLTWKKYLVTVCHNLERKQFLETLYQLQIFMKDYVRASMTCIRFYTNDMSSYMDLSTRTHLLVDAQKHLESELQVKTFTKKRRKSNASIQSGHGCLKMEMEPSEIDRHINTICRQMEIVKFLGNAEKEGRMTGQFLNHLSDLSSDSSYARELPTLFGNQQQKTHLAVLAILCGRDVEEGFGMAFRILQDYNLRPEKVYSLAGHVLALERKVNSIEQLIKCCRSSGAADSLAISDNVLAHCVKLLLSRSHVETVSNAKGQVDTLIRLISDAEIKINSYIESKQLKAAYLLAVKNSSQQDIRKILKYADRLGQHAIKAICIKWLQQAEKT
ncbi:zinc finger FYVE domain-containing protein 26 isoform X2 [Orussus abietinus]|uniref:zinc finger FYVE domain-containing protein 26 isoform X2 n=1 Tax=Orussus abietinus TaxID=222816 RepID=UPI0006268E70|nr:zinc finger FYVE domain-containing protein 26 isoform X2 [Orussus abietinus]